jgi:hypothetical protein
MWLFAKPGQHLVCIGKKILLSVQSLFVNVALEVKGVGWAPTERMQAHRDKDEVCCLRGMHPQRRRLHLIDPLVEEAYPVAVVELQVVGALHIGSICLCKADRWMVMIVCPMVREVVWYVPACMSPSLSHIWGFYIHTTMNEPLTGFTLWHSKAKGKSN